MKKNLIYFEHLDNAVIYYVFSKFLHAFDVLVSRKKIQIFVESFNLNIVFSLWVCIFLLYVYKVHIAQLQIGFEVVF